MMKVKGLIKGVLLAGVLACAIVAVACEDDTCNILASQYDNALTAATKAQCADCNDAAVPFSENDRQFWQSALDNITNAQAEAGCSMGGSRGVEQ